MQIGKTPREKGFKDEVGRVGEMKYRVKERRKCFAQAVETTEFVIRGLLLFQKRNFFNTPNMAGKAS